jgi:hypothetical protein
MDVREILHALVALHRPAYERAGGPALDELDAAIDKAHGYVEPDHTVDDAQAALEAAQRAYDEAKASKAAGVETTGLGQG